MKKLLTILLTLLVINLTATPIFDNDKDGGNSKKVSTSKSFDVSTTNSLEKINITFSINTTIESIKIIDSNSEIVNECGRSRGYVGSVISIPIDDLESGTYFIRIETENGVQVQRIIMN